MEISNDSFYSFEKENLEEENEEVKEDE